MKKDDIDRATPLPDYSNPHAAYTYYGFAAYWAQQLELALLDLFAAIRITEQGEVDDTTYKTAFEKLDRQTLQTPPRHPFHQCALKPTLPTGDERR
jgi:hypothetical protein